MTNISFKYLVAKALADKARFVKEAKFIEVNLNLKEVQKALILMDFDDRLERTISMLTGFKTSSL